MAVPKYDELFNPLLIALHQLGGSASVDEIEEKVAELLELSEDELNEIHRGNTTKINYRLAWARNYLKRYGLVENSSRGVWSLTQKGSKTSKVNKSEVNSIVKKMWLDSQQKRAGEKEPLPELNQEIIWQDKMLTILKRLHPKDFERLCQRVLREAGFIQVNVTGRSGDGGIDGTGIIRIGGFLSFRVIFQCKRYKGSVSPQLIREFKGTMVGRADKGLFITTGTFTREAKAEAARDGSAPVDLIDGDSLVGKMKELGLGVIVKHEETVTVDEGWFETF